jgi:hypothetical protein
VACAATEADLIALEMLLIQQERTFWQEGGYNLTIGGEGRRLGRQSAQEIARRAAKLRGLVRSAEHRAAVSAAQRGRKKTAEHIAKIVASRRGWRPSAAQAAAVGLFHKGRKRPPETGAKIAAALKGNTNGYVPMRPYCGQGHPMSGDNLYVYTIASGKQRRCCKICKRANELRVRARYVASGFYRAAARRARKEA